MTSSGPPGGLSDFAEVAHPVGRAALLAAVCTTILSGARAFAGGLEDPVVWVLGLTALAFFASALLVTRKNRRGIAVLPWAGLIGVFGMALVEGRLHSEALPWAPLAVMLIPVCLRRSAAMAAAFIVALFLPCAFLAMAFADGTGSSALLLRWVGLEGAIVFAGGAAMTFMRWRHVSLEAIAAERDRLQFVLENLRSGIAVTDEDGEVLAVNQRLRKLLVIDEEELVGRRFVDILRSATEPVPAMPSRGDDSSALDQVSIGDRVYEVRCDSHGLVDSKLVLWSFHEVTRRVRSYTEALGRLEKDALTGLYNRTHLMRQLGMAVELGSKFALLFIDLDGFKLVNDRQGHASGDAVLRQVASRLRSAIRGGDVACRLGGDEFCVITHGVQEAAQATIVADKVITALSGPYEGAEGIGASVGIALFPDTAQHPDTLLHQADAAMYVAKRKGGNRSVVARPSMDMETVA